MYVPAIKWRQGEYQALLGLKEETKDCVCPLITIPEPEFDFEEERPKKTVHEHVHPFAQRYKSKWKNRLAWIAFDKNIVDQSMNDGSDVFSYTFSQLRANQANAIPAISLDASPTTVNEVSKIIATDSLGVAVILRLEDLMKADPASALHTFIDTLGIQSSEVDVILDIGAPNFEPYTDFADALIGVTAGLGNLHLWRNWVLVATAIPETFTSVAKGEDALPRHEWLFYKELAKRIPNNMRMPNFGDHTIVHPKFKAIDMRLVNPSGKLIYTTPTTWLVYKGGSFRENRAQMHIHCAKAVASSYFRKTDFSLGDEYIAKCAAKLEGPSNQSRWKNVAINHHITHVIDDLAKLFA